ncbi:MAG: helix-turn-helix transcriptional regulator [Micromonosporaceae bacterium]
MATKRLRLAQRRKAVGYTQEQLAEQLGVDRTTVIRWEAGETEPHAWQRPNLADALKVSAEKLTVLLGDELAEPPTAKSALTLKGSAGLTTEISSQLPMLDFLAILPDDARSTHEVTADTAAKVLQQVRGIDFQELAQVIMWWTYRLEPELDRRTFIAKLSAALAMAAAAPIVDIAHLDWHKPPLSIEDRTPPDPDTLLHTEAVIRHCRHQGDVLGPELTLQTAMAQREILRRYVSIADKAMLPRVLVAYAEITQLVGWLMFNLGSYRAAQYYYDDARGAAHDAKDLQLVTYILCTMSHLATWQGKPRVGIDHALAASAWAQQIDNPLARAYAADVSARAFAADGQALQCDKALESERTALAEYRPDLPTPEWWYFYDESFLLGTQSECALKLGRADDALESAHQSLRLVDKANLHNYALTLSFQGEARIVQNNVSEASQIIGDMAQLTTVGRLSRIAHRITELRDRLNRWSNLRPVRQLDERLRAYGLAAGGNGKTKRL